MRCGLCLAIVLLIACVSGCGDSKVRLYPASGQLTVNGKPAEGATIVLHPISADKSAAMLRPGATVAADGTFSLSTYAPGDGAPAGDYRAVVIWVDNPKNIYAKDRLGNRYTNPEKSQWILTVNNSATEFAPIDIRDPLVNSAPVAQPRNGGATPDVEPAKQ